MRRSRKQKMVQRTGKPTKEDKFRRVYSKPGRNRREFEKEVRKQRKT